jgi:hypothetical protein
MSLSGTHIMTTRSLFVYQTPGDETAKQDPPPPSLIETCEKPLLLIIQI